MTKGRGSKFKKNPALNKILSRPHLTENQVLSRPHLLENQPQDEGNTEKAAGNEAVESKVETKGGEAATINTVDRERLISFQRTLFSPVKIIGSQEEIVPFAWRNPLDFSKQKRLSKYLKNMLLQKEKAKKEREKKALENQNQT